MRLASIAALAAVLATGCAAETDERPAEFAYIAKAILEPSCATATCHDAQTQREGLDFSSAERSATTFQDNAFVTVPDEPANNRIIFILRDATGEERMPIDGPMPDADVALIEAWIAAGAQY